MGLRRVSLLTLISLASTVALNIVSMAVIDWYKYSRIIVDADGKTELSGHYGLFHTRTCYRFVDIGATYCYSSSYQDLQESVNYNASEDNIRKIRAGGGLAFGFLLLNLLMSCFGMFMTLTQLLPGIPNFPFFSVINEITKKWIHLFPSFSIPCQVIAIAFWSALFPFYQNIKNDGAQLTIGQGLIVLITCIGSSAVITTINILYRKRRDREFSELEM